MDAVEFNFHSLRSQKARLGHSLKGLPVVISHIIMWLLPLLGLILLVSANAIGWLVLSLAVLPYMMIKWYKDNLYHLPSGAGKSVDALLSGDILGQLPKDPTPADVAKAISTISSAHFMAARFGITVNVLQQIASTDRLKTHELWQLAEDVRHKAGVERYSASVLAVALVIQFDEHEMFLAQINLNLEDLIDGVKWHQHIRDLIESQRQPRRTGGIARDWSFGYIPLLTRFGQNISRYSGNQLHVNVVSHYEAVDQLVDTFGSDGRQNAVLVGKEGVGKTSIIYSFADKLLDGNAKLPPSLRYRQIFVLDSSALIAAAPGRGELEGLIMRVLGEAYSAKNIIVCLDNAQLFFEEGIGSVDLSNVLQPILEAGRLRIILSMDEQRYLQIGQRNPGLINSMNRVNVAPTGFEETMLVLQEKVLEIESRRKVLYTYQSLKEAYRLSERYIHELEMPGRAIRLLESAASYSENGLVTVNSVQTAIEKTMDVKVSVAATQDDRDTLMNLEQLIHRRMIGQSRAVQVVSDALRRARAGVRNQDRPIGTFLFLGPTGVGKTELSKALAEVYFGGESRIIRIDLNEYVRPEDVSRLIADGADNPNSLTAQVMKQPFSVILFDEIEKAAPEVLATLLQLLDEGILRDERNREVSFKDAIIIATSNAGADRIREYIDRGYDVSQFEAQFTDELISSGQFRPEFLNRFDEIVVFTPLGKPDLVQVVDLMIAGVNKTLDQQKVRVEVEPAAKQILVERGYDPRLGARPMRRVVQKAVENTVAREMLNGSLTAGGVLTITAAQVEQILGGHEHAQTLGQSAPTEYYE